jgi:hypothetical protein
MKHLICWWSGHERCQSAAIHDHCCQCGVYIPDTYPDLGMRVRLQDWLRNKRQLFREWLRCPDCGRRFGRHDDSMEHLPF